MPSAKNNWNEIPYTSVNRCKAPDGTVHTDTIATLDKRTETSGDLGLSIAEGKARHWRIRRSKAHRIFGLSAGSDRHHARGLTVCEGRRSSLLIRSPVAVLKPALAAALSVVSVFRSCRQSRVCVRQ